MHANNKTSEAKVAEGERTDSEAREEKERKKKTTKNDHQEGQGRAACLQSPLIFSSIARISQPSAACSVTKPDTEK